MHCSIFTSIPTALTRNLYEFPHFTEESKFCMSSYILQRNSGLGEK
ncbi:hypothetical protein LEP1GSC172_1073 [Leptospira noguchii]|uniref:Uncharacterized protein n=1 Tax=Leptospira noguchii TaxID=28182 RepID=M6VH47_9LEPT|nr:hypothetical protein LEP1GSC172_1073 [Leptospira noguchii]